jgi:hypothetical protein
MNLNCGKTGRKPLTVMQDGQSIFREMQPVPSRVDGVKQWLNQLFPQPTRLSR